MTRGHVWEELSPAIYRLRATRACHQEYRRCRHASCTSPCRQRRRTGRILTGRRKAKRPQRTQVRSITAGYPPDKIEPYSRDDYPDRVEDATAGALGVVNGWRIELVYRFAIYRDLYVDWAIMLWATWDNLQHLLSEGTPAERRRIERTDCCESQIIGTCSRLTATLTTIRASG